MAKVEHRGTSANFAYTEYVFASIFVGCDHAYTVGKMTH
jgi:hypothetical protein